MGTDEVKRLKALETENTRLKKLVAEGDLEVEVMKEIAAKMVSAPVREARWTTRTSVGAMAGVRAAPSGALVAWLPVAQGEEGRARADLHARARGSVPALRVRSDPHHSSRARGTR